MPWISLQLDHLWQQTLQSSAEGMVYPLHSSKGGRKDSWREVAMYLENHITETNTRRRLDDLKRLVGDQALVIDAFKKSRQGRR